MATIKIITSSNIGGVKPPSITTNTITVEDSSLVQDIYLNDDKLLVSEWSVLSPTEIKINIALKSTDTILLVGLPLKGEPGEVGPAGPPGDDATVTAQAITDALTYTPANDAEVVHIAGSEVITGQKSFSKNTGFAGSISQETNVVNVSGLSVGARFRTHAYGGAGTQCGALFANVTTVAGETELPQLDGILTALYHSKGFTVPEWRGIESGAAFIDGAGSVLTNAYGMYCALPTTLNGGTVVNAAAIFIPPFSNTGIENAYAILSNSAYRSVFSGPIELKNATGNNVRLYSGSDTLVLRVAPLGLQIRDNNDIAVLKIIGGQTFLGGAAGNLNFSKPSLVLSGYSQIHNGVAYGDYGGVLFNVGLPSWSSTARRFLMTNALAGNKFAIIRSVNNSTNPTVEGTTLVSGIADFVINHLGNIGIGKESPTVKLDVVGGGRFTQPVELPTATEDTHAVNLGQMNAALAAEVTEASVNAALSTPDEYGKYPVSQVGGTVLWEDKPTGGGSSAFNPMTMMAEGNNEFACVASIIARPGGTVTHGSPIVWEILKNNSSHGSSLFKTVEGDPTNMVKISYPTVKNVLAFVPNGDESYANYGVTWGATVGVNDLLLKAMRPAPQGFRLQGNGTNWTAAGLFASKYSLSSITNGLTTLNFPTMLTGFDSQAISIIYTGENNYRIQRKYSGISGSAGVGFYLVDIATNAIVTTPPTSIDHVHITNFGQGMLSVPLNSWSISNVQSGNGFMSGGNFNFWCIGLFELWMKVFTVSSTELLAKWQAKTGVTTYKLYRDTNLDLSTKQLIYSGTALEFADTGLTANTMYYYQLLDQSDTEITQFNTKTKA